MTISACAPSLERFINLPAAEQARRLEVLARNALDAWGLADGTLRLIKYRENAVFEVRHAAATRSVLRVHRQDYHSRDALLGELTWTAMLSRAGLHVPEPIPTTTQALLVAVTAAQVPGAWHVDRLTWIDGQQLGDVGVPLNLPTTDRGAVFHSLGVALARIHNLTQAWQPDAPVVRPRWDTDGLVGERPLWGPFWQFGGLSKVQRDLVLRARDALRTDLARYAKTPDNYGLIHADMVPENVLVEDLEVRLIDFDDAGFGWHMFDIVTSLYWLADEPDFEALRAHVYAGYASLRALAPEDLAIESAFIAARSLTYLGWAHTRRGGDLHDDIPAALVANAVRHCKSYLAQRP